MADEWVTRGREMEEESGQVNRGWLRWEEDWVYLQCHGEPWNGLSKGVACSSFALEKVTLRRVGCRKWETCAEGSTVPPSEW